MKNKPMYPIYDYGELNVTISHRNNKLGNIPQFNTLPGNRPLRTRDGRLLTNISGTCGKHCGECFNDCYAVRFISVHHNHDKKQYYVNPTSRSDESVFDPLPILTCEGNGRGGGDYDDNGSWNLEMVGTWRGDMIEIRSKAPKGYERIYPEFMCDWMNGYYERGK